jgi:hypothetical protein
MKTCTKCKKQLFKTQFGKDKIRKSGLKPQCKICDKVYRKLNEEKAKVASKTYYKENKEEIISLKREYYKENKEEIDTYQKTYKITHKDEIKDYHKGYKKQRYQTDLQYKLADVLRSRLNGAIKNSQKAGSAVDDLGCTIEELKKHLESKFKPGMSWDNWTIDGWHIDHIRPLSKFDLSDIEQFKEACKYTNLQPLWAKENLSKGDNYVI